MALSAPTERPLYRSPPVCVRSVGGLREVVFSLSLYSRSVSFSSCSPWPAATNLTPSLSLFGTSKAGKHTRQKETEVLVHAQCADSETLLDILRVPSGILGGQTASSQRAGPMYVLQISPPFSSLSLEGGGGTYRDERGMLGKRGT